jgi:hypothetical protein
MIATRKMARYGVYFTLLASFVCFTRGALADDFATPTPTPAYLRPLPGGPLRRAEWVDRNHAMQAEAQSNSQARTQAKANRRATAAAQKADTKEAAHARAQAQREVAAEARHESAKESPHTNSDLMARMGFSEEEVAAQKAREQSGQVGAKEKTDGILGTTEHAAHTSESGPAGDHSQPPQAKPNGATSRGSTGSSPAPDPGSH